MNFRNGSVAVLRRAMPIFAVLYFLQCGLAYADDDNSGDISVTDVRGETYLTMNGRTRTPKVGNVIVPAATIATGVNGALELKQGATTVAVSASSIVELPQTDAPAAMLDRIVQSSGNVYYKVGKRATHKLRVETP